MPVHVRFLLDADCSPGLLPRVLQPFAKRDLTPDRMWSHRSGDTMHVEVAMEAMPKEAVSLIEGNLRQIVGVRRVVQVRPRTASVPSATDQPAGHPFVSFSEPARASSPLFPHGQTVFA